MQPALTVEATDSKRRAAWPTLFARVALGASFLSAVADRFGLYGPSGTPSVAWGDFAHFTAYTAVVNRFAPAALVPFLAWSATLLEFGLGILLIVGLFTRPVALAAGALLLAFALGMTTGIGIKAPLDYSVFSAAAAAFLVASSGETRWSLDALRG